MARKKAAKKAPAKKDQKRSKPGRPTSYSVEYVEKARTLCELGATTPELAEFFKVNTRTVNRWMNEHPEFCHAVKVGKASADDRVERALYERANGYSHPEEKIFCKDGMVTRVMTIKHYPPDPTACIFWLKNRKPDEYRERVEHTGADGGPIEFSNIERARRLAYILKQAAAEASE